MQMRFAVVLPLLILLVGLVSLALQLRDARAELAALREACDARSDVVGDVVKRLQLPSGRVAVMRETSPGQMSVQFEPASHQRKNR